MHPTPVITKHAIDRYLARVDATATPRQAAVAISRIIDHAVARSRPRHWSRVIGQAAGTRYLYSARQPDVCLVVAGGAVVTVHARAVCAAWRTSLAGDAPRCLPHRRRPMASGEDWSEAA